MSIADTRRANLRRVAEGFRTQGEFAGHADLSNTYANHLLTGYRNIGEKSARKIEENLGLGSGFLDSPIESASAAETAPAIQISSVPPVEIIESLLAGAIDAFEHLGQKPDPRVLAQVVVDGLKRRENEENSGSSPKQMIA